MTKSQGRWREFGPDIRKEMTETVAEALAERLDYGLREHGPVLTHPDPLQEALEENLDAIVYILMAMRERDELRAQAEDRDGAQVRRRAEIEKD